MHRDRIIVLGLDVFRRKNLLQVRNLGALGYHFAIYVAQPDGPGAVPAPDGHTLHGLSRSPVGRAAQVFAALREAQPDLHHVEIYPGGRFAPLYVFAARRLGIPVVVVERGDLVGFDTYATFLRTALRLTYRHADLVWYREPYQGALLSRLGAREIAYLPNAVDSAPRPVATIHRDLDFLWVNRLTRERKHQWLLQAMNDPALAKARCAIVGVLGAADGPHAARAAADVERLRGDRCGVHGFVDPAPYYARARFFVLPSDRVFGNHSLLEAMQAGVVPIVSDVEDARAVVEDGVSGIVFPHHPDGLRAAMTMAISMPEHEVTRMAAAAREAVSRNFSAQAWTSGLAAIYDRVGARRGAP